MQFNYNYNFTSAYNAGGDESHGTPENAYKHKEMMEQIANEVVSKAISDFGQNQLPKIISEVAAEAYKQAIEHFLDALRYDVKSCVSIGLKGCGDIFYDERTYQIVSDRICKEIEKNIKSQSLNIKF